MIVIELAVELDQIFGWSESANGSQRWRHYADVNEKDLQFGFHSFLNGISNYKKMILLPMICYWIGSGTWPDLWLKWTANGSQRWRWYVDVNEKDLQFRFHSFLHGISNYKKMSLLPNIVIELAVELDQIFGWSESANGSQRWRRCVDVNEKDLQFGFHSFLNGISNYKKMSLLPNIVIELAVELDLIFGWSESANGSQRLRWCVDVNEKHLLFRFHSFLNGISNYKKMSLLPNIVIELAVELDQIFCWSESANGSQRWRWCVDVNEKASPIWIPFIFAWYFKLQKNELVASDSYWIGSGTWPDLWLKWICQWIPKMKMMCWCKWKASPIWIPFIFEWYFKLQKNELVANDCYWIGSGTRPDLWLKWICQWIPKMKMMCWCKWKESPIRIPFIFEWYFKL